MTGARRRAAPTHLTGMQRLYLRTIPLDPLEERWNSNSGAADNEVARNARGCTVKAVVLMRHLDEQGRFIRQDEFCDEHVIKTLAADGAKVHDQRPIQV